MNSLDSSTSEDSTSSDVESDSEPSDVESGSQPSDVDEPIDGLFFLQNLVKIARKCRKKDAATFARFMASLPIPLGQAVKRRANDTKDEEKKTKKKSRKVDEAKWACGVCDAYFMNKDGLSKHQVTCKKEDSPKKKKPTRGKTIWQCDICKNVLSNKQSLMRHVKTQHEKSVKSPQGRQCKSLKYKCTLCKKERAYIYRHYGLDHNIDDPEQILFDDGTVLTLSDINTEGGTAAWFKKQLEKANNRYKDSTCRLCDVEFNDKDLLKTHYTKDHMVDPGFLEITKHFFRAEKGAHLGETSHSTPRTNTGKRVPDKKLNKSDIKKKVDVKEPQKEDDDIITMYKCKCGIATTSYDASVEHSQKHLVSEFAPDKKTCDICNFTFEASSFDDHLSRHNVDGDVVNTVLVIDYDFEKLLTEAWFDIFKDLPSYADRIVSSSVYLHSRSVKIHSESSVCNNGVLSYRCGMCQLFVDPARIENHCKNYDTCVKNKPKGHYCSDCDAYFYSANALAIHKDHHAEGFRVVTFNNKNDMQFNKALEKLQNDYRSSDGSQASDSQEEQEVPETPRQENKKRVEIISDQIITQFCKQCEQFVPVSTFEAHSATHQSEKERHLLGIGSESVNVSHSAQSMDEINHNHKSAQSTETEAQVIRDDDRRVQSENSERNVGNNGNRMEVDAEGTVELWDSDSDSCGMEHSVSVVHADINISVTGNENNIAKESPKNGAGTPELLLHEMYGANNSQESVVENNTELQSTQDLQQVLENDGTDNGIIEKEQENAKVVSQDIFSDDMTQNENVDLAEGNMAKNEERGEVHNKENDCVIGKRSNTGTSSRDILRRIITDDEDDDFEEESERSEFLKLNALIAKKLSSRN